MSNLTAQSSISISIGSDIAVTYVLGVTSAPPEYDGFGTLTLYDSGEGRERTRYVLIQQRHEQWHAGRYGSGLYSYEPSDALDERELARRLFEAMATGISNV